GRSRRAAAGRADATRCVLASGSAHPSTRRRWTVTGPGPGLFSEGLFAGLWRRRSTMAPLDSQPAATILQTESSRRSPTSDENVTLDRTPILQLDAVGTYGALDAAADCNGLRNDVALDLRTIADLEI